MVGKQRSKAHEALAAIARRGRTRLRQSCLHDPNAPGVFDTECRFTSAGYRVECATNGRVLMIALKGLSSALVFSVGQPDRVTFLEHRLPTVIGDASLPVFRDRDSPQCSPEEWLKVDANTELIASLGLGGGESVHVYRNGVTLYVRPRDDDENWAFVARLCALADALPREVVELKEGEELVHGLAFNPARLPPELQHLAPFIREWAIGDDVERSEEQERARSPELRKLVDAVAPHWDQINAYLEVAHQQAPVADEAILLGRAAEAAAEAEIELTRRES
jgi:hypothetical protein